MGGLEKSMEQAGEASKMATMRWATVDKHKNQVRALLDKSSQDLSNLEEQVSSIQEACDSQKEHVAVVPAF